MKIDFIADTNFLIYIHEGNEVVASFLDFNFGISFISEVELLGFKGLVKEDEVKLKSLIKDCFILDWNTKIKEKTIELKRKYNIKLPDAIIASTCLVYDIALVTADKDFSKIKGLDLILIEI
ncbi:MAG: type II toxin-antitoxin system VapC family toxin [Chitinophagaceae bacterium]|nr:MAG: type II toxin-antitoxin system VapC family toxin [Chitinophagaceae bacterium]